MKKLIIIVLSIYMLLGGCKKEDMDIYTEIEIQCNTEDGKPIGKQQMYVHIFSPVLYGSGNIIRIDTVTSNSNGGFLYQKSVPVKTGVNFYASSSFNFFLINNNYLNEASQNSLNSLSFQSGDQKKVQIILKH